MAKMTIRRTATGFKFDLRADNGETVATSEVYTSRMAARKGALAVLAVAQTAPCADLTRNESAVHPRFELFEDKAGRFRFRLRSRNGKIIAASEPYLTRYGAAEGIASVRRAAAAAEGKIEEE